LSKGVKERGARARSDKSFSELYLFLAFSSNDKGLDTVYSNQIWSKYGAGMEVRAYWGVVQVDKERSTLVSLQAS
jgi:hypothetical protein